MDTQSIFVGGLFNSLTESRKLYLISRGVTDLVCNKLVQQGSSGNTSVNFVLNPPSANSIIDSYMILEMDFTATFVGTQVSPQPYFLDPNCFGLRCYPLQSIVNTMQITFNGQSTITNNLLRMQPVFNWYGADAQERSVFGSLDAVAPDVYQCYSDGVQASGNPLSYYSSTKVPGAYESRGGMWSVQSIVHTPAGAAATQSVVTGTLYSYVNIGMFVNLDCNHIGISNVQNLQLQITFGDLRRMFSLGIGNTNSLGGNSSNVASVTSCNVNFTNQRCSQLTGIAPPDFFISSKLEYGFPQLQVYNNNCPAPVNPSVQPTGVNRQIMTSTSSTIQVQTIPTMFYIWVQPNYNTVVSSDVQSLLSSSDNAYGIQSISINFANKSGLLSSATTDMLWQLSVRNGYQGSFSDFAGFSSGQYVHQSVVSNPPTTTTNVQGQIGLSGSFLALNPASDLSLAFPLTPDQNGSFNFSITINYYSNRSSWNPNAADNLGEIMIITNVSGIISLMPSSSFISSGLVTPDLVVESKIYSVPYQDHIRMMGSARLSKFKKFFDTHGDALAEVGKSVGNIFAPRVTKAISAAQPVKVIRNVRSAIEEEPQAAASGSGLVGGLRAGSIRGGGLVGGKYVSNAALKKKIGMA